MGSLELFYWTATVVVLYPYAIYPAWLGLRARWGARPVRRREGPGRRGVSIVLTVYNEVTSVERRLRELTAQLAGAGLVGEVIVVSDGSIDGTAEAARAFRCPAPVRVIELAENVGKAAALSIGVAAAQHEIVAVADARQTWAADALARLLENFDDPEVGAVSGELHLASTSGVMAGVGLYWRYEKWLRRREGLIHSTVGVTGAIAALRRELYRPIPPGTVLDDVYWPLVVVMQGYRVVYDGRARAYDRLPERIGAEFFRKVRTLAGTYQLIARLPSAVVPGRNPAWLAMVSHKLARLAVPWALLAMLVISAVLRGPFYGPLFAAQAALTLLGVAGLVSRLAARSRIATAVGSFLMLNGAAWVAFWVWISGRAGRSWSKIPWQVPAAPTKF